MEQTQLVASFPDSVASDGTLGGAWERGYTTCTCLHIQTVYYQVERREREHVLTLQTAQTYQLLRNGL